MKKTDRQKIYDKYDGRCAYCGEEIKFKDMQVDHVISKRFFRWHIENKYKIPSFLLHLKEEDVNHIDNLFPACRVCNKWKSALHLELFRDELSAQIKRLNNYSSNYRIVKKYGLVKEEIKPIVFYFETLNK
jgi:5-methylcytosine-specific restriction endonuclease McrA